MCVEPLTKSPRESLVSVFQNSRWRPKWPPISYLYHNFAPRCVRNMNLVSKHMF